MYVPAAFRETDPAALHEFLDAHGFALLVTQLGGEPFATHLPVLLDRSAGSHGTLFGHLARANPQAKQPAGTRALVVFSGPHAYVSPTWYAAADAVPTWNYTAAHAAGPLEWIDDPAALLDLLRRTADKYEAHRPAPWAVPVVNDYLERQLKQIVGFRIPLARLDGKWKLGQNHPAERRARVVRALSDEPGENAAAVAALMRATLPHAEGAS